MFALYLHTGPTFLLRAVWLPQVPGARAGAPHPGEGNEPGLAASLLTVIPTY